MIFSINIKNINKSKPNQRYQKQKKSSIQKGFFSTPMKLTEQKAYNNRFYKITKHFQINTTKTEITNHYHQSNQYCMLITTIPMKAFANKNIPPGKMPCVFNKHCTTRRVVPSIVIVITVVFSDILFSSFMCMSCPSSINESYLSLE